MLQSLAKCCKMLLRLIQLVLNNLMYFAGGEIVKELYAQYEAIM